MTVPHAVPNARLPTLQLPGITVLQRGWLSSNNVLLHGHGAGAVLVDSSHVVHTAQTVALLQHALQGEPLRATVNTHLHSDHCGGNAAVQGALGGCIVVPPGAWHQALHWPEAEMSHGLTGQRCARFKPDGVLSPGQVLQVGRRRWQVLAAPGHDPDSLILFDAGDGTLISADALWENGLGVVFPELEGRPGFDEAARVLDLIATLDARCVIPGHGAPFSDVAGALQRARSRLDSWQQQPERHLQHAWKVLLKYHLMEERQQDEAECLRWFCGVPLCQAIWQQLGAPGPSLSDQGRQLLQALTRNGAVRREGDVLHDA